MYKSIIDLITRMKTISVFDTENTMLPKFVMCGSATQRLALQCGSPICCPYAVKLNANRTGSTGKRTRLWVRGDISKFQIVHMSIEPSLSAFGRTAYGTGIADQQWSTSLHAADSLIKNGIGILRHFLVPLAMLTHLCPHVLIWHGTNDGETDQEDILRGKRAKWLWERGVTNRLRIKSIQSGETAKGQN